MSNKISNSSTEPRYQGFKVIFQGGFSYDAATTSPLMIIGKINT